MANEYSFKQETCYVCGFDLTGAKSAETGLYKGVQPQGKCPGCGRSLVLDAPPIKPEMPVPAVPEPPPARATRSRKVEPEPEAEPEPEPEPEPE